jgi:glycosyl transferase family 11
VLTYRLLGRNGRLGNQLWQIASTTGIARARGETAGFPFWRYRQYFSVPDEYFPDLRVVAGEDLGHDWLQEIDLFSAIEPLIRQMFTFSPLVMEPIAAFHREFLALPHRTAIHVRRGDYLEWKDVFASLSDEYFEEAMALTSPPYAIFSDDIPWCRKRFGSDCIYMTNNRDFEDLALMASCDAVVTANSTFSWWGAWMSKGRRIYPRRWFGPGMARMANDDPMKAKLNPELMLPPGAIVLDS